MKYARFLIFPIWYLIAISCATQSTPMGGPKDTIPPSVVRYHPKENSKNFKGKEIVVEFDEAVVLNNPKDEILIIPSIGTKTEFKLKGTTLTITPEKPLKDSTTYNINFREGVKDLTEGNPAKDLRNGLEKDLHLAFSTGPVIDTLSISGHVKNALDEKIPDNITIALYTADTFDIFEDTPEYFTKSTKKTGEFSITNLKAGKYKMYAFEDKNKNLKAETRSEKFGFISQTIELDSVVTGIEIAMMNINTTKARVQSVRNQSYFNTIRFSKPMITYQLTSDAKIQSSFSNNQTEITAYYPDSSKVQIDSLMIGIKAMDSTLQTIDTLIYIKRDKNDRIKEKFTVSNSNDLLYNLETNMMSYTMTYNKPIKFINNDSVYLRYDTITVLPLKYRSMKVDTIFNRITVNEMIPFDSLPKSPAITFGSSYLVSIENDSSKQIQMPMKLVDSPTTAILTLTIQTKEPHYIIQIVNSGNKVIRSVVDQKNITLKFLNPEIFKIRAVIDKNANGVWDPAIYPQNREAERIIYYINAQQKMEVPLRANWDIGPLVFKF